jgi:hypothetical protein
MLGSYLRGRLANPAAVLLSALRQKDLPTRVVEALRRWLRQQRPPQAEHWNLLTDLRPEHLPYAA